MAHEPPPRCSHVFIDPHLFEDICEVELYGLLTSKALLGYLDIIESFNEKYDYFYLSIEETVGS